MRIRGWLILVSSATAMSACGSASVASHSSSNGTASQSVTRSVSTTVAKSTITERNGNGKSSSSTTGIRQDSPTTLLVNSDPAIPGSTTSGLQYGPGPQVTYSVQPQPTAGSCHYTYEGTYPFPDPHCTPGALNPQVTQSTIGSTICISGYTSSIRPPESITEPEKIASARSYSYTGSFSTAEFDHLVPLELGGDPNDPANLWIEPNDNPNATSYADSKDRLENRLHSLVCSGQLSLTTAQEAIASNWVTAYRKYVGNLSSYPTTTNTLSPSSTRIYCTASAAPANDGYVGDYYISIDSNQPRQKASASDAGDTWSWYTNASGYARILLYHTSPGEEINVTVGEASCSTTA